MWHRDANWSHLFLSRSESVCGMMKCSISTDLEEGRVFSEAALWETDSQDVLEGKETEKGDNWQRYEL